MRVEFPESFWLIAEQIGHARCVMNEVNKQSNSRYDRGDKNEDVDTLGVVGELIAMDALTRSGFNFEFCKLLDHKSNKGADVVVNGNRVDVKTNRDNRYSNVLVNEEAHYKGLNSIDSYWFVYILDRTSAEFYFATYEEVGEWQCKQMRYSTAFYARREDL